MLLSCLSLVNSIRLLERLHKRLILRVHSALLLSESRSRLLDILKVVDVVALLLLSAQQAVGLWHRIAISVDRIRLNHARAAIIVAILEQVEQAVGAAYEVRMVRVYAGILDFEQVHDHRVCRGQALVEHLFHHVADLAVQFVELGELWDIDLGDHLSELLIHLVAAIKRWLK